MGYAENVERNLEGLTAVSTGICPGCDRCREEFGGFAVEEDLEREPGENAWYLPDQPGRAVYYATEEIATEKARELFDEAWATGDAFSEPSFSSGSCGICNSHLGGNREVWHGIDANGEIMHFQDACTDCVMYLANGDLPEQE
jgi:hypothetical protein